MEKIPVDPGKDLEVGRWRTALEHDIKSKYLNPWI
jgi:hypothetical protein